MIFLITGPAGQPILKQTLVLGAHGPANFIFPNDDQIPGSKDCILNAKQIMKGLSPMSNFQVRTDTGLQ